jgi:hypothetical protein
MTSAGSLAIACSFLPLYILASPHVFHRRYPQIPQRKLSPEQILECSGPTERRQRFRSALVDAFRSGDRMGGGQDDDYNGGPGQMFGRKEGGHTQPRLKLNKFKWILFAANFTSPSLILLITVLRTQLSIYSTVALIFCLHTWF